MAARDAVRHRAASVLIMVLIGLPVLLVVGASAFLATTQIDAAESVPVELGTAQAKLLATQDLVVQSPDGRSWEPGGDSAASVPGHRAGEDWTSAQLATLTGAPVTPISYPTLYADRGRGLQRFRGMALDPAQLPATGLARLESGRWPTRSDEAVVTDNGMQAGLPSSGTLTLQRSDGGSAALTVVGIVSARNPSYQPVQAVVGPSWLGPEWYGSYLVLGDRPVDWVQTQRLNRYGLVVSSRLLLTDPPAGVSTETDPGADDAAAIVVLICLALVLETTLLAGPAFAVSAARRRRSLALVAGNGADRGQLIRYVLAQAVVLGTVAALAGAPLGTVGGWAAARLASSRSATTGAGPLDSYLPVDLLVVGVALLAAMVAALLPARGLARAALAGSMIAVSARPAGEWRRVSVVGTTVGLGLVVAGTAGAAVAVGLHDSFLRIVGVGSGAVVAIVGALVLLPWCLRVLLALTRTAPVALRLAARDAARARGRTTSALAAILVAVAVLTVLSVALASSDGRREQQYTAQAVAGHGLIHVSSSPYAAGSIPQSLAELARLHPDWRVEPRGQLGDVDDAKESDAAVVSVVAAVAPGCRPLVAIGYAVGDEPGSTGDRCHRVGSNTGPAILTFPADALDPPVALTAAQSKVLADGGLLVADRKLVRDGSIQLAVGHFRSSAPTTRQVDRLVSVPAAVLGLDSLARLGWQQPEAGAIGALGRTDALAGRGLVPDPTAYEVMDPDGPISRADERTANAAISIELAVERGWQPPNAWLARVLAVVAGALAVAAAVVCTGLAQQEAAPDLRTMTALGADRTLRHRLAGSQAALTAATGAALGLLVGIGPAAALGWALTVGPGLATAPPPVIDVPWLTLAAVLVGVPVLATLTARLVGARAPVLSRRLT